VKSLRYHIRQAFLQFRRSPGVTMAAVLCLAIAIGGGAVLYQTAVEALLQPSPATMPNRVVRIYTAFEGSIPYGSISYPDFEDIRDQIEAFEYVVIATPLPMNLASEDRSERTWGEIVSADYFHCLGVDITMGRSFLPEEGVTEGTHPVVVISHRLWKNRFGGDPDILSKQVYINGNSFSIIGVAPEGFNGDSVGLVMRLWVPVMMHAEAAPRLSGFRNRGNHSFRSSICRLKDGVTVAEATERVRALSARLAEQYPDDYAGKSLIVMPENEASLDPMVRADFQRFITFGFVIIALLLALTCANVAGLLLARTAGRRKEIGIRLALGVSRSRLMGSLLAESAVLAVVAGLFGYWIANVLGGFINRIEIPMDIPLEVGSTGGNWPYISFIFLATGIAAIIVGLTPAIHASRVDIVSSVKAGDGASPRRAAWSRRLMVMIQVAASLVILVGGGLVLKSLRNIQSVDPGFDPANQLVANVDLALQGYSREEGEVFYRDLKERLGMLPGVKAVGMALTIPLSLSMQQHRLQPEGYESPDQDPIIIDVNTVDEGYFEAMGIPIAEGRAFTVFDDEDAPLVIIVNEAFRNRYWPGESPLGKRARRGDDTWYTVVGMVPTGKYFSLGEDPKPYFYYSSAQEYTGAMNLHIRTTEDPLSYTDAIRSEVAALDPTLPVSELNTMRGRIGFALMPYRIATVVMWTFALVAMLLASIGLYGLVAYMVQRQTRELGIRMALGAQRSSVLYYVVGRGMRLTVAGLAVGLVLAIGICFMASKVLVGLDPIEPLSLSVSLILMSVIAFLACLFPARRATRINPSDALRVE